MDSSRRGFLRFVGLGGTSLLSSQLLPGCSHHEHAASAAPPRRPKAPEGAPQRPWWLSGNFAPITEEIEAVDLAVTGAIPPSLSGLYLRNGPNPASGSSAHWFLGDGMVHGLRIERGRATWYRNRYVQTRLLRRDEQSAPSGPRDPRDNRSNTSVLAHAGRLLSLEEDGLPYELSIADLSTVGPYNFAGRLAGAMTAHPKIDPRTGELLFFGYGFRPPFCTYYAADAQGNLVKAEPIARDGMRATMMHDFQATATRVIFMDLPVVFDLEAAMSGRSLPFRWTPSYGARLGVMPRSGGAADVTWFEIEPCFIFHTINAYDAEDGRVVLEAARHPELWRRDTADARFFPQVYRYTLDPTAGTVREELVGERLMEFPHIDLRRAGARARFAYGVESDPSARDRDIPPVSSALLKVDLGTGEMEAHAFGETRYGGEFVFVPHAPSAGEDEGWLMGYVYDAGSDRSSLVLLDASDVSAPPVASIELPCRVPFGFHGAWLGDDSR